VRPSRLCRGVSRGRSALARSFHAACGPGVTAGRPAVARRGAVARRRRQGGERAGAAPARSPPKGDAPLGRPSDGEARAAPSLRLHPPHPLTAQALTCPCACLHSRTSASRLAPSPSAAAAPAAAPSLAAPTSSSSRRRRRRAPASSPPPLSPPPPRRPPAWLLHSAPTPRLRPARPPTRSTASTRTGPTAMATPTRTRS
jgi:hypothetical protein